MKRRGGFIFVMVLWGAIWGFWDEYAYPFAGPFMRVESGQGQQGPLYRSPLPSQADYLRYEEQYGIRRILRLNGAETGAVEIKGRRMQEVSFAVAAMLADKFEAVDLFFTALYFLRDPQRPATLVHCLWGKDRTGALVTLYKLTTTEKPVSEALPALKDEMKHFGFDPVFQSKLEAMLDWLAVNVETVRYDDLTRRLIVQHLQGASSPVDDPEVRTLLEEFLILSEKHDNKTLRVFVSQHPFFLIPVTVASKKKSVPLYELPPLLNDYSLPAMIPYLDMAVFRYRLLSREFVPASEEATSGAADYLSIPDWRIREIQKPIGVRDVFP